MKIGATVRVAIGLVIVVGPVSLWYAHDCALSGAALAAPLKRHVTVKSRAKTRQDSSVIPLPAKQRAFWPDSVTLSPNGRWLAVVASGVLLVRDMRTGRWIRDFGAAYYSARWHPTKPVLIAPDGSADKPDFYIAYLSNGKKHQLFRADPDPFALTRSGMLWRWGIVDFARSDEHGVTSHKFGYPIPWDYGLKAVVVYMSGGPNDQVAAEVQSLEKNWPGLPQWVETYRKVPGRRQWVRSGKIEAKVKGKTTIWYPRNPSWLGDGRLVYLRIYPAEWTHSSTNSGKPNPKYLTAKNRAELWVCSANGTGQRKITTIWDLRLFEEIPSSDWITVDRQGKNVYYLSGKVIRQMRVAIRR